MSRAAPAPRRISIGLQGGGAHGAFEWGVLDALLEDGRLEIAALSGASAGAMNAVVLASGFRAGGAVGGRDALKAFWRAISDAGPHNPFGDLGGWGKGFAADLLKANPFLQAAQSMAESFVVGQSMSLSPYQFNPFNLNPLRDALSVAVDFAALRKACAQKLFVSATEVLTARSRVFQGGELTVDHVLASACLPYLFQAVEIDGKPYWDGGYLANPPLWPLFYNGLPRDVLVINLNPFRRQSAPREGAEIQDRLNEVAFNATLVSELRAVAFVNKLVEDDLLNDRGRAKYQSMRLHMIPADGALDDLPLSSKFNTDWSFLTDLHARGRRAAQSWLSAHLDAVGRHSSVDVRAEFL